MYRMFYRGQYIGNARQFSDGEWTAVFINGDSFRYAHRLKNKSAAKRWLTEMYLNSNSEATQCA